jgi:adenine-specific DNA glycosylase
MRLTRVPRFNHESLRSFLTAEADRHGEHNAELVDVADCISYEVQPICRTCRPPMRSGCRRPTAPSWFGAFMPSKTPRDIIEKFHAAGMKVLNSPEMQRSLQQLGVEALPMTPGEMDHFVARETAANFKVIKAAGIK